MNIFKYLRVVLSFDNFFQVLINRVIFGNTGPTVYRFKNLQFLVDHHVGDQDGPRACVAPGLYDPFLEKINFSKPITIIDLGANAGGFILALRKAGLIVKKGVAVELNPLTWSRLIYNSYANIPNANDCLELLNAAVCADGGILEIKLGRGGVGDSISGSINGSVYRIPKITLPELIERFDGRVIDLLKIDIEGAEYSFLELPYDILEGVVWIIIEIHEIEDKNSQECTKWIEDCGFDSIPLDRDPVEKNVFLFKNRRFK